MANISKIKRDKMIAFLEELKKTHSDDESIRAFNEIENSLIEKKYGLVFEEHTEEVDERLQEEIPVLCEDKERRICKDENLPWNFIIEGDNLQALYLLEKTHKGKIDCIYIDPPYNTGAKDWKYNNNYVDGNDVYRHSKWLSMMKHRLLLAQHLLRDDGVLICAIDENELENLLLLIQDTFGESYITDCITIVHNPRGVQGDNFSYIHEYAIFVYKKNNKVICDRVIKDEEIDWRDLRDNGGESLRTDARNCFYPIIVKNMKVIDFGDVVADPNIHPLQTEYSEINDEYFIYPIDKNGIERKWRYARQSVDEIKHLLRVKQLKDGRLDIELGKNYGKQRTVWADKRFDANQYGTQLINSMVPNNGFDFPKSLYNVYECVRAVAKKRRDAIILDFFAGSGTTQHAVNLLNAEDGGHRQCIMITNNEVSSDEEKRLTQQGYKKGDDEWEKLGIAKYVTWPRTVCSINGCDINGNALKGDYGVEDEAYILDDDSIVVSKKTGKPLKRNLYKKTKAQTMPELVAIKKSDGFKCNVKYFKCDWIPRRPEDYLLSNALCLHIKEMIELQTGREVDGVKQVLILNKDDYNKIASDSNAFAKVETICVRIMKKLSSLLLPVRGRQFWCANL
mgnify:CR=1 FL=1